MKRNMEFHSWISAFRRRHSAEGDLISQTA
jgi:hypothetical protein